MSLQPRILNRRRVAAIGTSFAAFVLIVGLSGAIARNDDGSRTFFLGNGPVSFVARHAASATAWVHDLTISIHPRSRHFASARRRQLFARTRSHAPTKMLMAQVRSPAQEQPVTMYNDLTLQPGDAVMTDTGIRVFRGGRVFPYSDNDFVGVTRAAGLSRTVTRTLASLSIFPGG